MRILLLILFSWTSITLSQSSKIKGFLFDQDSTSIPGATVMLIGAKDSILKSFAITDKNGQFILRNVKEGDYLFKVNAFGFESWEQPLPINSVSIDTTLAPLFLAPELLDVVEINEQYVPIRFRGDTIEYDSRAFETGEHDVVEDLLMQLPGVEVQPDGSIKVQGKEVDQILVDGKPFFGNDPTIATKNLPADAVDKVQVFDKSSEMATFTGVDDGDESTTVNLKLKEDRKKGYFGQTEGGFGAYQPSNDAPQQWNRYTGKGNLHYFKNKWQFSGIGMSNNVNETGFSIDDYINFMGGMQNLMNGSGNISLDSEDGLPINFGSNAGFLETNALGFNTNFRPNESGNYSLALFFSEFDKSYDKIIQRSTFFADSTIGSIELLQQYSRLQNSRSNFQFKQTLDTSHFLTGKVQFKLNQGDYSVENEQSNFSQSNQLRSQFNSNIIQERWGLDGMAEIDYRFRFKAAGRYLGLGADFQQSQAENNLNLTFLNQFFGNDPVQFTTIQRQHATEDQQVVNGNIIFSEPLSKKHLIQAAYRFRQAANARNRNVTDELENGTLESNPYFSGENQLINLHNEIEIQHKYISKTFKSALGVVVETVNMNSADLFESDRNFQYLRPFYRMDWEINRNSRWRVDYLTKVQPPQLSFLQSIPVNINPAELILGNQALVPEYRHELALEFNYFREFNFTHFMVRGGAQHIKNKINYMQSIDAQFNRVLTPQNTDYENQLNTYLSFGTNLNPLRVKFSIKHTGQISQGQIELNDILNNYTSIFSKSTFTIENQKKKIVNLKGGMNWTWSKNAYSENNAFNGVFTNWNYYGDITIKHKDTWVLNVNATHYFYPDFTTNTQQLIVNTSIARNFLPSKKLQVYIAVNDLFNQNNGISQSYFMNEYQAEEVATLARYYMFGVRYSFKKLGGK